MNGTQGEAVAQPCSCKYTLADWNPIDERTKQTRYLRAARVTLHRERSRGYCAPTRLSVDSEAGRRAAPDKVGESNCAFHSLFDARQRAETAQNRARLNSSHAGVSGRAADGQGGALFDADLRGLALGHVRRELPVALEFHFEQRDTVSCSKHGAHLTPIATTHQQPAARYRPGAGSHLDETQRAQGQVSERRDGGRNLDAGERGADQRQKRSDPWHAAG